jgi:hypothetical protein
MEESDASQGKPDPSQIFAGGSGESVKEAVIIKENNWMEGVGAEYYFIEMQCGKPGTDWELGIQSQFEGEGGKEYDHIEVRLKDGTTRDFYFEISSFYGNL